MANFIDNLRNFLGWTSKEERARIDSENRISQFKDVSDNNKIKLDEQAEYQPFTYYDKAGNPREAALIRKAGDNFENIIGMIDQSGTTYTVKGAKDYLQGIINKGGYIDEDISNKQKLSYKSNLILKKPEPENDPLGTKTVLDYYPRKFIENMREFGSYLTTPDTPRYTVAPNTFVNNIRKLQRKEQAWEDRNNPNGK